MSGHSKWANIKYRKGAQDAKRGALFTKLAKQIEVAARQGGDPEMNYKLKLTILKARAANVPNINIEKAIKKGTGEDRSGATTEEIIYEGIGPGKVGIIVQVLTDNRNRTVAELRRLFSRFGGNLGASGSVVWQFENRGVIQIPKKDSEESLIEKFIEAGAEDFSDEGEFFEVYTAPQNLSSVRNKLAETGVEIKNAELSFTPKNTVKVSDQPQAQKLLNLLSALEEHDDVGNVYSNFEVENSLLEQIS